MNDPVLAGLVVGAVVGFAGITLRLLQAAALVGVGVLAWLVVQNGPQVLEDILSFISSDIILPYLPLIAGLVLGAILGGAINRVARGKSD